MANRNLLDPRRAPATPPEAEQGFVRELRHDFRHEAGRAAASGTPDRKRHRPRRRPLPFPTGRIPRKTLLAALPVVALLAAAALVLPGRFDPASGEYAARTAGTGSESARSATPSVPGGRARSADAGSPTNQVRPEADAPASGPDQVRGAVASAASGAAETIRAAASAVGDGIASVVGGIRERAASVAGRADPKVDRTAARSRSASADTRAGAPTRAAAPTPRRAPRPIGEERTVVWGDSLRYISRQHYGDEMLWPLIWDYNKRRAKLAGQNMENPDLIYPGWKFIIPERE